MDFLEIKANCVYLLRVKVKTNAKKQEILSYSDTDSWLSIKLKSKPVKNKANKELINLIKKKIRYYFRSNPHNIRNEENQQNSRN